MAPSFDARGARNAWPAADSPTFQLSQADQRLAFPDRQDRLLTHLRALTNIKLELGLHSRSVG